MPRETAARAARLQAAAALSVLLSALLVWRAAGDTFVLECPSSSPCCADRFSGVTEQADVQYGTGADLASGSVPLFMDAYRGTGDTNLAKPVMILVHGGGFTPGLTKRAENTREEARAWARRGFLALSIEYRRWNTVAPAGSLRILTDPVHDLLAAVRYVVANSGALGADPLNIGLSGTSAGAITVAHAVILDLGEGAGGNAGSPSNVSIAIAQSGGLSQYLYAEADKLPADIPAYFAIHGTGDRTVPFQQAVDTRVRLDVLGVPNELYAIDTDEHTPSPFTTAGRDNALLFDDMVGFAIRRLTIPACLITQLQRDEVPAASAPQGAGSAARAPRFLLLALFAAVTVVMDYGHG
jgi:hypothetical protein